MKVETYEVDEVSTEHPECAEEAVSLMEQLGLKGQLELAKPSDKATVFPYRKMTKEEATVFQLLCPTVTPLESFKESQIPVRVLQVALHAKTHFTHLLVMHPERFEKDPVLIGCNKEHASYYPSEWFLLARWGEELDAWSLLMEKAAKRYTVKLLGVVEEQIVKLQALKSMAKAGVPEDFMIKHAGVVPTLHGAGT